MKEDYPQSISIIDSILAKSDDKETKFDLLGRKHYFLSLLDPNHALLDTLLYDIHMTDRTNLEYRIKYIRNLFDKRSIWRAITEYYRFQADVENTCFKQNAMAENDKAVDVQEQIKANKLMSELEQLRLLVQIKLQSTRQLKQ